ncbi:hypothetical protein ACIBHY_15740 [Nonomuraea sp. NPDC050547]|uniref:Division protein CdvB (Snf7/Vps24/ESCRT-III family) n=1 Tax=Nonomuraea endophytica TaxID=714136 RepID=A0A7W8A2C3_9ACTN|nr:hypothetical protein [Nonomuraea endophytica]MBB5078292.1 division protein CdvB (Snf7/Vps24/ESCRT-III family) [Nonomuraea endophytica]
MRLRFVPLALFASAVFLAGCGEVNSTIDKAQACLEAPKIVADLVAEVGKFTNDPKAMDKAIDDAATKLNGVADKASNTTLKEATDSLATSLGNINVKTANDAVDSAQKVTADTAAYLEKIAKACS